jgi:hypothetical protein
VAGRQSAADRPQRRRADARLEGHDQHNVQIRLPCQLLAYHNNLDPAAYYQDARLEMPALLGSATLVPLLQQYQGYEPVKGGPTPPQYAGAVTFSPSAAASCQ